MLRIKMTEAYKCLKGSTHGLVYTNIRDPAQTYSRTMNKLWHVFELVQSNWKNVASKILEELCMAAISKKQSTKWLLQRNGAWLPFQKYIFDLKCLPKIFNFRDLCKLWQKIFGTFEQELSYIIKTSEMLKMCMLYYWWKKQK